MSITIEKIIQAEGTDYNNSSKQVTITLNSSVTLDGNLPSSVIDYLRKRLIIDNPKYLENERRGYSNWNTPEKLSFLHSDCDSLILPRGFACQLIKCLKLYNVSYQVIDKTVRLPECQFGFKGELFPYQREAIEEAKKKRFGVLTLPPGAGKTVIALGMVAHRKQPTLIITHTKELLYQWINRIETFLGIPRDEIGVIGDKQKTVGERITVAIINSVYPIAEKLSLRTGFLIVDECHRTPSRLFTEAVRGFESGYMLGLSATPYRRDGLTQLIYFYLGDEAFKLDITELQSSGHVMAPSLRIIQTGFDYPCEVEYQDLIKNLVRCSKRNGIIVNTVVEHVRRSQGIALVISDRKTHCQRLGKLLSAKRVSNQVLTGKTNGAKRKRIVEELNSGKVKCLVATGQLIGEGFDLKALSSIFLTTPVKFSGRLKQYIGRILRVEQGKQQAVIYDFEDSPWVLKASLKSRKQAYSSLGVSFEQPILNGERH